VGPRVEENQAATRLIAPRYMTALSNEEAFAELWYSRKAIKDLLGVTEQRSHNTRVDATDCDQAAALRRRG
jgi:hypothetical protein